MKRLSIVFAIAAALSAIAPAAASANPLEDLLNPRTPPLCKFLNC